MTNSTILAASMLHTHGWTGFTSFSPPVCTNTWTAI